ncbi:MAG: PASTA domain-containing protein [Saprospiraceae bacterium]
MKIIKELWLFLSSVVFIKNCLGVIAFIFGFIFITTYWLKCYTDHGESLAVPSFIGMSLEEAQIKAKNRGFTLVVSDSTYRPGMPPHVIYEQNPKNGRVKKDRTFYLAITKAIPDIFVLPDINNGMDDFEKYAKRLKDQEINAEIVARKYHEILEPNTILEVIYKGDTITKLLPNGIEVHKGESIQFVVSERENTIMEIPNLICKKVDAAKFIINSSNIILGNIIKDKSVTDEDQAYVWKQEPPYQEGSSIRIGEQITIYITAKVPNGCE